jgi:hypothetical protein
MEQSGRARPRLPIPRISVRFVAEGVEAVGQLHDVSRQGLYVRSADLPRPGAVIALQFESPLGRLIDVRGEVRWSSRRSGCEAAPDGFGVRLHEPPAPFRDFVAWVIIQCEKSEEDAEAEL